MPISFGPSGIPVENINALARRRVLSPIYKRKENEDASSSFAATDIRNPRAQTALSGCADDGDLE
jgi:hypothetical protein